MAKGFHDYNLLISRWRNVARNARMRLKRIADIDGYPLFCMHSPALLQCSGIYLSAGIHGDEPASTEGLVHWAECNVAKLRDWPLMIFPCLNPWGLVQNRRSDASGSDLNRQFHDLGNPLVSAVRATAERYSFRSAMMLHEDYDADGVYIYEVRNRESCAEAVIGAAEQWISRDSRRKIEGRRAVDGILRPRFSARTFEKMGTPEAIWMYRRGCRQNVTFETPSEFAIERRIGAQSAAVTCFVQMALAN
jgi:murein peptide amidase A